MKILRKNELDKLQLNIETKENTNTVMEGENMVRKAETLKSLDELNLSTRTKTYLEKNFDSIDEIISEGRHDAFMQDLGLLTEDKAPKWNLELISSLRKAGFIRPATDFLMTFHVSTLYRAVYKEWGDFFPATSIGQLSSEQYETFVGLSTQCIEDVRSFLQIRLSMRECEVISLRFGLDCTGIYQDLESIGRRLQITRERVRQLEAKALRRLRHPEVTLPAIFEAPSNLEETAKALHAELEEFYKSPAFKRANEVTWELKHIEKVPFRYTCEFLKAGSLDNTSIDKLDLSVRAYNCLRRAGINTIADIVNLPNDDWFIKVRNLGRKALDEIIEKMHLAGYGNFNVDIPSTLRHWPAV